MPALPPPTARFFARLFARQTQPASDRANADLVHELMRELEDDQPSALLVNLATGFPSALLSVLAAGALAGALAGRQVGQPLNTIGVARAAPVMVVPAAPTDAAPAAFVTAGATRHSPLEEQELQALAHVPGPALQLPLGDGRRR